MTEQYDFSEAAKSIITVFTLTPTWSQYRRWVLIASQRTCRMQMALVVVVYIANLRYSRWYYTIGWVKYNVCAIIRVRLINSLSAYSKTKEIFPCSRKRKYSVQRLSDPWSPLLNTGETTKVWPNNTRSFEEPSGLQLVDGSSVLPWWFLIH